MEFITSTGKLIVDGDMLQVINLKERSSFGNKYLVWWLLIGMANIYPKEKIKSMDYFIAAISGVVLLGYLADFFYRNKWKNRFHIGRIKSIFTEPDAEGLETKVVLHFRSGTAKEIFFRTSENQHERFVTYIEQLLTQTHFA